MTLAQIGAILALLAAFNVSQPTISNISNILIAQLPQATSTPTTVNTTPMTTAPNTQTTPASAPTPSFGSATPTVPVYDIKITTRFNGKITTEPLVGTISDTFGLSVEVSKAGKYVKEPVNVTTNDPDFADSTFQIQQFNPGNNTYLTNFFCVAPHSSPFINDGCPIPNPVSKGTFTFNFTVGDASKDVQVTVQ